MKNHGLVVPVVVGWNENGNRGKIRESSFWKSWRTCVSGSRQVAMRVPSRLYSSLWEVTDPTATGALRNPFSLVGKLTIASSAYNPVSTPSCLSNLS